MGLHVSVSGSWAVLSTGLLPMPTSPMLQQPPLRHLAGLVVAPGGKPMAVVGFTRAHCLIVAIDLIADPQKLRGLALEPQA
jgi:hypothetical protein